MARKQRVYEKNGPRALKQHAYDISGPKLSTPTEKLLKKKDKK